jgi:hypothetical protein
MKELMEKMGSIINISTIFQNDVMDRLLKIAICYFNVLTIDLMGNIKTSRKLKEGFLKIYIPDWNSIGHIPLSICSPSPSHI